MGACGEGDGDRLEESFAHDVGGSVLGRLNELAELAPPPLRVALVREDDGDTVGQGVT